MCILLPRLAPLPHLICIVIAYFLRARVFPILFFRSLSSRSGFVSGLGFLEPVTDIITNNDTRGPTGNREGGGEGEEFCYSNQGEFPFPYYLFSSFPPNP